MIVAMRKHMGDVIALVLLFVVGVGVAGYILEQPAAALPARRGEAVRPRGRARRRPGRAARARARRCAWPASRSARSARSSSRRAWRSSSSSSSRSTRASSSDDATALLRAKTGLKDMFLEVDPGDGEPLEDGGRIQVANTAPDIDPDEFLSALDADTRDYLRLLITGAGQGPRGRRRQGPARGVRAARPAAPRPGLASAARWRGGATTWSGSSTATGS